MELWNYWNSETLEPWNPGTLEPWNPGTLELLELWNSGTLELWNPGTLELWNSGTLELWNYWNSGTLEPLHPPDLRTEPYQPLVYLLVAAVDLVDVVDDAFSFRGEGGDEQGHAGADVG